MNIVDNTRIITVSVLLALSLILNSVLIYKQSLPKIKPPGPLTITPTNITPNLHRRISSLEFEIAELKTNIEITRRMVDIGITKGLISEITQMELDATIDVKRGLEQIPKPSNSTD